MLPLLSGGQGPRVIVGDFNATQHSAVYELLTSGSLQSAHEAVGRGYATTWPNGRYWLPPIRIDHAFVSAEAECVSIAEGRGRGSDHRPLILDVRVRKPVPARSSAGHPGGSGALDHQCKRSDWLSAAECDASIVWNRGRFSLNRSTRIC
jgi:hypothetical protein